MPLSVSRRFKLGIARTAAQCGSENAVQPRSVNAADVANTIGKYLLDCSDARGVAA